MEQSRSKIICKFIFPSIFFIFLTLMFIQCDNVYASSNTNIYTISVNNKNYKQFKNCIKSNQYKVKYEIPEIKVIQLELTDKQYKKVKQSNLVSKPRLTKPQVNKDVSYNKVLTSLIKIINKGNINSFLVSNVHSTWDLNITNQGYNFSFNHSSPKSKIAILDSGISKKVKPINKNISKTSKNLVPKNGFNGRNKKESGDINDIQDKSGHGTFVASQIVGANGIYPNAKLAIYRTTIHGSGHPLWTINGIVKATKDNANIINISNGIYFNIEEMSFEDKQIYEAYKRAIEYAQNRNKLIVVAAGNNHLNFDNTNKDIVRQDVPSNFKNVITVASTNKDNHLSSFSNYGKEYIDIAAPTGDVDLEKQRVYGIKGYDTNGNIISNNGTSFAAPKVSGALAFITDKYSLYKFPFLARNILYYDAKKEKNYSYEKQGQGTLYLSQ